MGRARMIRGQKFSGVISRIRCIELFEKFTAGIKTKDLHKIFATKYARDLQSDNGPQFPKDLTQKFIRLSNVLQVFPHPINIRPELW